MILDTMENMAVYALPTGVTQVLNAVKSFSAEDFAAGKVFLDGENVYLNKAAYETHAADTARMEAHRKYLDVMCVLEGEETVYVYPTRKLNNVTMPYSEEKECLLADFEPGATAVRLTTGMCLILFPQDAHAPGCDAKETCAVKKIIGKVRI